MHTRHYALLAACLVLGICAFSDGKVWDWGCSSSIDQLSYLQQSVASAYSDFESATDEVESAKSEVESADYDVQSKRRLLEYCQPSRYNDCDFERAQLKSALSSYDDAVDQYNQAYEEYERALEELNDAIESFSQEVQQFSSNCLN